MIRYIIRRCLGALLVVIVISMATFAIYFIAPRVTGSDPSYLYVGRHGSPAQVAAVRHAFGLDQPVIQQYWAYMKGIFTGRTFTDGVSSQYCGPPCLGYSFQYQESVTALIKDRFPVTFSLALGASILWLTGGVLVGIISALKRGSWVDRSAMIIALAGVSLPVYFTGLLLLFIFTYGPPALRWFPNAGQGYVPFTSDPWGWFTALVLPWISLAFLFAALYARLTRANMLETMGEDYIRTARAKGLPARTVVRKHALRAALTPIVTIFGLDLAGLLGGAILTEYTFSLQGLGKLSIDAIAKQDLPVIMGVVIVGAILLVVANIVVDVLYAVIDPRVRYS
jgi:peptide/nickel transport system permease protein